MEEQWSSVNWSTVAKIVTEVIISWRVKASREEVRQPSGLNTSSLWEWGLWESLTQPLGLNLVRWEQGCSILPTHRQCAFLP